jgi:tRNA(Ile2) C34 agmatinyltransferase TiaS
VSKSRDILFEAQTPLGFTVRVTKGYWAIITTLKHPVMAGCEAEVQKVLESPEEIRRSKATRRCIFSTAAAATGAGSAP